MRSHRSFKNYSAAIANAASQSEMIPIEDAVAGAFFVPAAFTNVGGTNLIRFGVSNNFGKGGTALTALVPTTTIATAQSQQGAVSTLFAIPPEVFNFPFFRFDGVTTEGGARVIACQFKREIGVGWEQTVALVANGGTTSQTIDLRRARGGNVLIPAAITSSALAWHVSLDGNTFVALQTSAAAAISQGVAVDRLIPIPAGCFSFPWLRLVLGSAEGAARNLVVNLKR